VRGRVGDGVADDVADFDGAGLVEEEHGGWVVGGRAVEAAVRRSG
jgi:hypothetical protein